MDLSFTISKDPGNIGSGKNEPRTGRRRSAGLTAAAAAAAALVFLLTGCGRIPGNPAESSTFPQESALAEETAVHAQTEAVPQTTDIPPDRVTWQETPDTPPDWVTWQEKTEAADLDGDGTAETLTLEGRSFTARRGEALLFETPEEWQTADLLHADIDRDGTEEVLLLVWKQGSYGDYRPFWVEENDSDLSEHIFIYKCDPDRLRPVWMSSALDLPVRDWTADAEGRLHLTAPDGSEQAAAWEGWGLKYLDEAETDTRADTSACTSAYTSACTSVNTSAYTCAEGSRYVTLLAVGDNIAHPSVYEAARVPGTWEFDFSPIYERVRERVSSYDISVVNQETILVESPAERSGYPRFGTPASMGDALAGAGFDVVLGATNHAMDKGPEKILRTVSWWREHHPEVTLLGLHDSAEDQDRIPVIEKNGIRIAMLDFTYGLNGFGLPADAPYLVDLLPGPELPDSRTGEGGDRFTEMIRRAEQEADVTVCFLHIGTEYAPEPDDVQIETVRRAVDAGADAVICAHPHVVQRSERIRTPEGNAGVVFYSLGNFMSNQTDPATFLGGAAELRIVKTGTAKAGEAQAAPSETGTGQAARIESFRMIPTVCHFRTGETQVYFLEDYTDELAAEHQVPEGTEKGMFLTTEALWKQWQKSTKRW